MSPDTLGVGIGYPFRVSAVGGVQKSRRDRHVRESIRMILGTAPGERVMRPTFGCNLASLVFAPNNAATANLAQHYVERALGQWEPRIRVEEVTVQNQLHDRSHLLIHVHYVILATQERGNLVHPFYLREG